MAGVLDTMVMGMLQMPGWAMVFMCIRPCVCDTLSLHKASELLSVSSLGPTQGSWVQLGPGCPASSPCHPNLQPVSAAGACGHLMPLLLQSLPVQIGRAPRQLLLGQGWPVGSVGPALPCCRKGGGVAPQFLACLSFWSLGLETIATRRILAPGLPYMALVSMPAG